MDTLVAALRVEANRLQERARSLGQKQQFDEAREELLAWAKTLDEFPQHPELTHLRLMIEQEATYYRPAEEHFKKESDL